MLLRTELRTLAEKRGATSVSLYMPTVTAGSEIQQNPIRFKNLLDEANEGFNVQKYGGYLLPFEQYCSFAVG